MQTFLILRLISLFGIIPELEAKKKMEGEREREQLKAQRKAVKEQRKRDYEAAQVLKQKEDKKKTKVTAKTKSKPGTVVQVTFRLTTIQNPL